VDVEQKIEEIIEEEEINQICVHPKSGQYLCAAMDSGAVAILDLQNRRVSKHLRKHKNICAASIFHPRNPWDLVSGGYDQMLFFWDFSRGRLTSSFDMKNLQITDQQGGVSQVINPPFVHSLAYTSDGRYLAAGLGDGTISLLDHRKRACVLTLPEAHKAAVSQVLFTNYENISSQSLISTGNDKVVNIWDVEYMLHNNPPTFSEKNLSYFNNEQCLKHQYSLEDKPNWAYFNSDGYLFIADTSCDISLFQL